MITPRHILCVLGTGLDLDEVERAAKNTGFELDHEYSETGADPRMPRAFRASAAEASFTEADWDAVESHDTVAYVLARPTLPGTGPLVSGLVLELTARLLRAGATAAKDESNGLTHGRDRWLELADAAAGADDEDERAVHLYHAFVKRTIFDGELYYSCGMHLLGLPDVEVEWPDGSEPEPDEVAGLIDALALYLLTEERGAEVEEGEGFRLAEDAPRWILRHHPCDRYEDDLFANPFGYWRLTPDEPRPGDAAPR
ncbi:hypothetical protein [Spirillospora sp. NPDC047279]|uniref:hypothetical protein n=1 Tax=Spirillospora sp. NPDC047279 TaxID=3155478 RepID=UPI0033FA7743